MDKISDKRVVFFGEVHETPEIVALQSEVLRSMVEQHQGQVNVVLEQFSFEMQTLLDRYVAGRISFEEMYDIYKRIGTEGFRLEYYKPLFELARENPEAVKLHGGFLPKTYAGRIMREGEKPIMAQLVGKNYIPVLDDFGDSDIHYNIFESMMTDRDPYDESQKPNEKYRRLFKAQLIKDKSMAHKVNQLLLKHPEDRYLVIAGFGHLLHYQGVPERVFESNPQLRKDSYLMVANPFNEYVEAREKDEKVF